MTKQELQSLQFPTKYYRVLDSTFDDEEAKKMIGGVYELRIIDYARGHISLYTKDRSDYWYFNFSDVQEVLVDDNGLESDTFVVDGYRLGIGDRFIDGDGDRQIVIGNCIDNVISLYDDEVYNYSTDSIKDFEILPFKSSPIGSTVEVEIDGKKYWAEVKGQVGVSVSA